MDDDSYSAHASVCADEPDANGAVVSPDGDQDDQSQRDLAGRAIANAHARLGHPLDDGSHPLLSVRAR